VSEYDECNFHRLQLAQGLCSDAYFTIFVNDETIAYAMTRSSASLAAMSLHQSLFSALNVVIVKDTFSVEGAY
jgi:hypothetical protein